MFLLVFQFTFLSIDDNTTVSADSTNNHIYVCNGVNASAAEGASSTGSFGGIGKLFSSTDYNSISFDNENYVSDSSDTGMHQYHEFRFNIDEDVEDITRIDITWKGYGGDDLSNYGYSLWVMESGNYVNRASGTKSSKDTLAKSYTTLSDINAVINGGSLYIGVQSDYTGEARTDDPPFAGVASWIKSYYLEVSITYNAQNDECQGLVVSNPISVVEMESFDVTVTSCSIPIENALVGFNGLNLSTNEFGVVSFSAPEVESDTPFDIFVYRAGYVVNVSSISVLDNSSNDVPVLDISVPASVEEYESFEVTVTSDSIPVSGVMVSFSGNTYYTDVYGAADVLAPGVNNNKSILLSASKSGYLSDETSVLVLNIDSQAYAELVISSDNAVYEGEIFTVTVSSQDAPISGVLVGFNDNESSTNLDGKVTFYAPYVDSKTYFTITASKGGYISDSKTISVLDALETNIVLISPNGDENLSGDIDVVWDVLNPPAQNLADPSQGFLDVSIYYKNDGGSWVFLVEGLNANIDSYSWDTTTVENYDKYLLKIVLSSSDESWEDLSDSTFSIYNAPEEVDGWIYGSVFENNINSTPIEKALFCVYNPLSIGNTIVNKCQYTNDEGYYNIIHSEGTYSVKISKTGYETKTFNNINIELGIGTKLNVTLNKTSNKKLAQSIADYTISEEIKKGKIAGTVDVRAKELLVDLYQDINVDISSSDIASENGVDILVSGEGESSTKLIIYLGFVEDKQDIQVIYDGLLIEKTSDIEYFFSEENNDSGWILVSNDDKGFEEQIVIVNIPHFSQHQITIKISDVLTQINAVLYYVGFLVLVATMFLGIGFLRKKYY